MCHLGAGEIVLTSMDRHGTKAGYNLPLTRAVADAVPVPVIASGGVGTLEHLAEGVTEGHASAVLAASIFHFGTYSIAEAKACLAAHGLPVRPVEAPPRSEEHTSELQSLMRNSYAVFCLKKKKKKHKQTQ